MATSAERSLIGKKVKDNGEFFERLVINSARFYENHGISVIDKTPEPMKILQPYDRKHGKFIACFAKQAQPDFKGALCDSTMILFDAKHTDRDRIERKVVTEEQEECFERYSRMGALCFLVVSLRFEKYYRVPWVVFRDMQRIFGHKYMKEMELDMYRIPFVNGVLRFLDGLELKGEAHEDYEA